MATVIVATQGWRMTRQLLSPQHIFLKNTCSTKSRILGKLSTFSFLSNLRSRVFILLSAGWFAWLGLIWSVFPSTSFCHVRLLANKRDKNVRNIIAFDILFNLAISFETVSIPPITSRLAGPGCWAWRSGERFTIRLIFPQTPNCTAQSLRNVTQSSNGRQLPPLSYGAETKIQCNADINND